MALKHLEIVATEGVAPSKPVHQRKLALLLLAAKHSGCTSLKKTGLSKGHTIHVLKDFVAEDFVVEFQLGGRTRYYLLTEKGLKLGKEITSERAQ